MALINDDFKAIGAVLMASGFSKRMGQNKLLMAMGKTSEPCVRLVAGNLLKSGVGEIVVVYQDKEVFEVLKDLPLTFIQNLCAEQGQSQSVKLGAAHTWKAGTRALVFCVGDQPLITAADYQRLFDAYLKGQANVVLPRVAEETFSPVIFDLSWREELLNLEGDRGGKVLLSCPKAVVKEVLFKDKTHFMDMDAPEDYETLKGLMSSPEAWRERA